MNDAVRLHEQRLLLKRALELDMDIQDDGQGQLVIYTGLKYDRSLSQQVRYDLNKTIKI
jgi:hypothetical protein